jgi:cation diffusion facilitator family transporter
VNTDPASHGEEFAMHTESVAPWSHDHTFGQDRRQPGESRTRIVVAVTVLMMAVEIAAGLAFGSMALLADGLHMASHAVALSVSAFAYAYARRHARDARYTFGTGKVNALGGYSGAVLLATFAALMVWGSAERLLNPVDIVFDQAILVALLGLVVNGVCALILRGVHGHEDHGPDEAHPHEHDPDPDHDHNLRSAYLHVLADALTSVLAIGALLAARYLGLLWADPAMGFVGALLVTRWSCGLLRSAGRVLLDRQAPPELAAAVRGAIESDGDARVADLHLWAIGPGLYALILSLVARRPESPDHYRARLPGHLGLAHVSIEVRPCPDP